VNRVWFLILALSLGLNAGLLYVQTAGERPTPDSPPTPRPHEVGPDRFDDLIQNHLERMSEGLQLNEDQSRRLQAVHRNLLPRMASASRELDGLRRAVGDQYGSPEMDPDRLRGSVQHLNRVQASLDSLVVEAMLAEAAVLSPEQRARYARGMPWGRSGPPPPRPR
jgi:Spy/CpxP family protein refolding chaperone